MSTSNISKSRLKINGYEFTEFEANVNQKINQPDEGIFKIDFAIDANKNLNNVDLRNDVLFYVKEKLFFKGNVVKLKIHDRKLVIHAKDPTHFLLKRRFNHLIRNVENKEEGNFLKFIGNLSGFQVNLQVTGMQINNDLREFNLIIPILNLNLKESIIFGDFSIKPRHEIKEIPELSEEFLSYGAFAAIRVNSTGFYDVILKGKEMTNTILNLINFRIKDPMTRNIDFSYSNINLKIKLADIYHIREMKTGSVIELKNPWFSTSILNQESDLNDYLNNIKDISLRLTNPKEQELFKELRWILYYLDLAENSQNKTLAFQHLWVALEFLVKLFYYEEKRYSKEEMNMLTRVISNSFNYEKENLSNSNNNNLDFMKDRVIQLVNQFFNNPSFMDKMYSILKKLDYSLNESEKRLLKKARKTRNAIIHGRGAIVSEEEILITSKIIYWVLGNSIYPSN